MQPEERGAELLRPIPMIVALVLVVAGLAALAGTSGLEASGHSAVRSFSQSWAPPGGQLVVTITATNYGGFGQVEETLPAGLQLRRDQPWRYLGHARWADRELRPVGRPELHVHCRSPWRRGAVHVHGRVQRLRQGRAKPSAGLPRSASGRNRRLLRYLRPRQPQNPPRPPRPRRRPLRRPPQSRPRLPPQLRRQPRSPPLRQPPNPLPQPRRRRPRRQLIPRRRRKLQRRSRRPAPRPRPRPPRKALEVSAYLARP